MKIKQQVQELFPTPLWILDIAPADAAPFNAKLRAEVEAIISPRPKLPIGRNWQTPHDLHTRPAFAELAKLIDAVSREGITIVPLSILVRVLVSVALAVWWSFRQRPSDSSR